jgi:hypothetical protein
MDVHAGARAIRRPVKISNAFAGCYSWKRAGPISVNHLISLIDTLHSKIISCWPSRGSRAEVGL